MTLASLKKSIQEQRAISQGENHQINGYIEDNESSDHVTRDWQLFGVTNTTTAHYWTRHNKVKK